MLKSNLRGSLRCLAVLVVAGCCVWLASSTSRACPFCFGSQQLTLRERIETPDASVLVEWQSGEPGNINTEVPASTTFTVQKVWRGDLIVGESLTTEHYYDGRPGERFLLVGNTLDGALRWDRAIPLSAAGLEYVVELPSSEASVTERLHYAFTHLESADTTIANDAFDVVAASKYEDLAGAREHLNVDDLRRWVHDPDTLVMRLGVYGMLLGLAGSADDVPQLHRRIFATDAERSIRVGIDGVMGGYLLLAGADGLDRLDAAYLKQADVSPDDLNAVTSALRFMWEYGNERIAKDRLRRSMRLALHHEVVLELAIIDLARWQDWEVTPLLVDRYRHEATDDYLRRKIIGFLIVAADAPTGGLSETERAAVELAAQTLETIRAEDASLFRKAERGLIRR